MNKQEAIEIVEELGDFYSNAFGGTVKMAPVGPIIDTISQIHEPQKVVVPKFVAEWLEEARAEEYSLYGAWEMVKEGSEIFWWLFDGHESNQDTFNRAWLDGYETEQEKLYTVEIPNNGGTLVLASIRYAIQLVDSNKHFPGKFTKESIEEAGFGWVFDCDGVKVVAVEWWIGGY